MVSMLSCRTRWECRKQRQRSMAGCMRHGWYPTVLGGNPWSQAICARLRRSNRAGGISRRRCMRHIRTSKTQELLASCSMATGFGHRRAGVLDPLEVHRDDAVAHRADQGVHRWPHSTLCLNDVHLCAKLAPMMAATSTLQCCSSSILSCGAQM